MNSNENKIIFSTPIGDIIAHRIIGEIELNRAWLYDENDEVIGETNFVLREEYLEKIFEEKYKEEYDTLDSFLESYEPEDIGEEIYQLAITDGELIEDLGQCYYGTIKCFFKE